MVNECKRFVMYYSQISLIQSTGWHPPVDGRKIWLGSKRVPVLAPNFSNLSRPQRLGFTSGWNPNSGDLNNLNPSTTGSHAGNRICLRCLSRNNSICSIADAWFRELSISLAVGSVPISTSGKNRKTAPPTVPTTLALLLNERRPDGLIPSTKRSHICRKASTFVG